MSYEIRGGYFAGVDEGKGPYKKMDLIKEFFFEAFPNPERTGSPDEETLMALAEGRLPPGHPARLHPFSCSECYAEYRGYLLESREKPKAEVVPIAKKEVLWPNWVQISSSRRTGHEVASRAMQRVREWIKSYRHRYLR